MDAKNEIIKVEDLYADLGEIKIASTGETVDIVSASIVKRVGQITLTVRPRKIEDAECEVVQPLLPK